MKPSLRFKFTFFIVLIVSISLAAISTFLLLHEKKLLQHNQYQRAKLLSDLILNEATDAVLEGNAPGFIAYCANLVKNEPDIEQIIIVDTGNIIYAHNNPSQIGKRFNNPYDKTYLRSDSIHAGLNPAFTDFICPFIIAQKRTGTLLLGLSNSPIEKAFIQGAVSASAFAAGFLVLAIFISIIMIQLLIVNKLKLISIGVEFCKTGDFNRRIPVKSSREIASLTESFNAMNESLAKQKKQLLSLFNTVQSLDTSKERKSLIEQTLAAVQTFINPRQSILCFAERGNIIIKGVRGIDSEPSPSGSILTLPNEIFIKTFRKQTSRKCLVSSLMSAFNELGIEIKNPSDEALISPLVHSGKSKGLLVLIGKMDSTEYSESESLYADIISLASAMSLFNIELIEKSENKKVTESEYVVADLVKRFLMPQQPFRMNGIELCSYYRPATDTHGNWHGFIEDKEQDRLVVCIGDATGHGSQAALSAAVADSVIKTLTILKKQRDMLSLIMDTNLQQYPQGDDLPLCMSPSYILTLLNKVLFSRVKGKQTMTFFASTFDLRNKKLHYANAGHEIPILLKKMGNVPAALTSSGPRLGDTDEVHYDHHTLDLESGDIIVWYTIGVTQCRNTSDESYGTMPLLRKIQEHASLSAQELCKKLVEDINAFRTNVPLIEDITLVTAKII